MWFYASVTNLWRWQLIWGELQMKRNKTTKYTPQSFLRRRFFNRKRSRLRSKRSRTSWTKYRAARGSYRIQVAQKMWREQRESAENGARPPPSLVHFALAPFSFSDERINVLNNDIWTFWTWLCFNSRTYKLTYTFTPESYNGKVGRGGAYRTPPLNFRFVQTKRNKFTLIT